MLLQLCHLCENPLKILLAFVGVFGLDEASGVGVESEPGEEEREGWPLKEALLRLLGVLVHGLADDCEVHVLLLVVLVVSVGVHHRHQHLHEFSLVIRVQLRVDDLEVDEGKGVEELGHRGFLLLVDPLFLEGGKQELVELAH